MYECNLSSFALTFSKPSSQDNPNWLITFIHSRLKWHCKNFALNGENCKVYEKNLSSKATFIFSHKKSFLGYPMKLVGRSLIPHVRVSWSHEDLLLCNGIGSCKVTSKKQNTTTSLRLIQLHLSQQFPKVNHLNEDHITNAYLHVSYKTGQFVENNIAKCIHNLLFKIQAIDFTNTFLWWNHTDRVATKRLILQNNLPIFFMHILPEQKLMSVAERNHIMKFPLYRLGNGGRSTQCSKRLWHSVYSTRKIEKG